MAPNWYYSKDGQQHGPISSSELKRLAASGQMAPTDKVRRDGDKQWFPASKVKGLFGEPPDEQSTDTDAAEQTGLFHQLTSLLAKRTKLELALMALLVAGVFVFLILRMFTGKAKPATSVDSSEVMSIAVTQPQDSDPPTVSDDLATMEGGAWLTKNSGVSDTLPGLVIYALPLELSRSQEIGYWTSVQSALEIQRIGEDNETNLRLIDSHLDNAKEELDELKKKDSNESVSSSHLLAIYQIYTLPLPGGFSRPTKDRDSNLLAHRAAWGRLCEKAAVAKATVRVDGSYSMQLPKGNYLLFAERETLYSNVQWSIETLIKSNQREIQQDFFNDNAQITSRDE